MTKELVITIHGPQGPTGMGHGVQKFTEGIRACERRAVCAGHRDGWANADPNVVPFHIVVEQPAFTPPSPWNALVPTFELPLREEDEVGKVVLPTEHHRMFCLNPYIQEKVMALNPDAPSKCFPLIQQGADPVEFEDVIRRRGSVGIVGKYEPRKGYNTFFGMIRQLQPKSTYAMATSPLHTSEEITELQNICDGLDINLLPWEKSYDSVLAFLSSVHVAVFPSHAEGWNLPLTEALAQGCIVVASDIHAHRWQKKILADAIGEAQADYRLRLVPTVETPIAGHDRWYPGFYYVGKKWLSCGADALAEAVACALEDAPPEPWAERTFSVNSPEFPLTWKKAGERIITLVDEVVNKNEDQ